MIKKNKSLIVMIAITSFVLVLLAGCGGVAKNPTQPGWQGKDQGERGPEGERQSEGSEIGAPEIAPGASFEELMQTGNQSLEGGFIKTAAEAFQKAHEDRRNSPDAALAYVIAKIVGSPEEFSLLMQPGLEFFYYNTPLIGRWELLPAPLAEEDSYLLRLAALGTLYGIKSTASAPPVQQPAGSNPTTVLPEGSNKTMTGEDGTGTMIPGAGTNGETGLDETGSDSGGDMPGQSGGDRSTQMAGPGRSLNQDLSPAGGSTQTGGDGKLKYEGTGQAPQIEYLDFEKDIFPNLIDDYRELARSYSAGFITLDAADSAVTQLKSLVDDLVGILESAQDSVEDEEFALELPFNLDEKPGVYNIYFKNVDYMIVYGYLQLIQSQLAYRSAYNSSNSSGIIFAPPSDGDSDNVLTPSEYYPGAPYGELIEKGNENLAQAGSLLDSGLEILVNNFDTLYNDDRLADFRGNLLVPINVDHLLVDLISEERDRYSDYQVILSAGHGDLDFKTPATDVKARINISYLFGARAPASVRLLLPNLDAKTYEPVLTAESNIFPDPTWGGVFPDGFDNFDVFLSRGDISGVLTDQGTGIKDISIAISDSKSTKTNEKGVFTLKDIQMNELVGITVKVTSSEFPIPIDAQLRSFWVLADKQVLSNMMTPSMPAEGMMETMGGVYTTGDGMLNATGSTGGGGENPMDRIKEIRDQHEKDKSGDDESGDTEEGKAEGETPASG
ncbi:hypothetical protein J7L05_09905 [bacterium]|nr:hypothetical protein [bacterium]